MLFRSIASVGGRSAHEIAERFLERAAIASEGGLTPDAAAVLTRYLAISASPERALDELDAFQREVGIDMGEAIDLFAVRNDALRDCGIELDRPCGELVNQALEQGLLINVTVDNVVRLLPPLTINRAEAGQVVDMLVPLIRTLLAKPLPKPAAKS